MTENNSSEAGGVTGPRTFQEWEAHHKARARHIAACEAYHTVRARYGAIWEIPGGLGAGLVDLIEAVEWLYQNMLTDGGISGTIFEGTWDADYRTEPNPDLEPGDVPDSPGNPAFITGKDDIVRWLLETAPRVDVLAALADQMGLEHPAYLAWGVAARRSPDSD